MLKLRKERIFQEGMHIKAGRNHSKHRVEEIWDHEFNPPRALENKTQGSNTIMSTSFALEVWSNKIFDVAIVLSITMAVS